MKQNILFDCDPGHDDIMAILCSLAHPEKLNILGYTAVCGNNTLQSVARNLLNVLSYLNHPAQVALGCDCPLIGKEEVQSAHGKTGLDGFSFPEPDLKPVGIPAAEFMREKIMQSPQPVVLVAMGPLTNVAVLLKAFPEVKENLSRIVLMGGAIEGGNILPHSEFNIYADPFAAEITAESGVPLTICPLEVCQDVSINEEQISTLKSGGHVSRMAYGLLDFYFGYARAHHMQSSPVFDLCTILYLLYPDAFTGYACRMEVILQGETAKGMTLFEPDEGSSTLVLTHAEKGLIDGFLKDLSLLDERWNEKHGI